MTTKNFDGLAAATLMGLAGYSWGTVFDINIGLSVFTTLMAVSAIGIAIRRNIHPEK